MNISELIEDKLGITYIELFNFAITASNRYKTYSIPKKNGKKRTIHHPSKTLKLYQRFLIQEIFNKFAVHDSVFSYRKKTSIKDLAECHKDTNYLIRIDFRNFFPSLKSEHIRKFLNDKSEDESLLLSVNDITLINLLVCKNNQLTIGAPSSPIISNILLFDFDEKMSNFSNEVIYSRYADDLYFSTNKPNILQDTVSYINKTLLEYFIKLKINHEKTIYTSNKHKKSITGLVITSENKVSIGRLKKRYIKSLIFKFSQKTITNEELIYLKGYLSFVKSVEETFIISLRNKYGEEIINNLNN